MSYADIVEFMFQSGCVMDKCGMKAVSESKSDCFGLIGAYHIWDVWQVHTRLDGYGKARRCRRSARSSTAGGASPPHGMAARQGARHHARLLANLQADYDLLTFDPSTLDDIRPLVEA